MMLDDLDKAVLQGMDIQEENINGFKVISGLYIPDNQDDMSIEDKIKCLSEAFKIYELMYQMKLLDIPRNMQELSDKEKEEGKMMYEIITESVHEISKMHMKFINNVE